MNPELLVNNIKPELVVLVAVLYAIGMSIKNAKAIADATIPFILGGIGVVLASLYVISTSPTPKDYKEWLGLAFVCIIQGISCAAGAVYANQMFKQGKELKHLSGDKKKEEKTPSATESK